MNLKEISIFELIPFYLGPLRGALPLFSIVPLSHPFTWPRQLREVSCCIYIFFPLKVKRYL